MLSERVKTVCRRCGREIHKDKLSGTSSMGDVVPDHQTSLSVLYRTCDDCKAEATHESFTTWFARRESSHL